MTYEVDRTDKEVYDHCEKHHLQLLNENGDEMIMQRVSFSKWQLDDGSYSSRVKQWAERRVKDLTGNEIDRETDIKLVF